MTKDKLFTFHALHHFYGMIQIFIVLIVCNRFIFTLIIFVIAARSLQTFSTKICRTVTVSRYEFTVEDTKMANSNHDNRQLLEKYFQNVFFLYLPHNLLDLLLWGQSTNVPWDSPGGCTGQVTAASALSSDQSVSTAIKPHLAPTTQSAPTQFCPYKHNIVVMLVATTTHMTTCNDFNISHKHYGYDTIPPTD